MTTIGIDFGTSNSAAAVVKGRERWEVIESAETRELGRSRYGKSFPSYVTYDKRGEHVVAGGESARAQAALSPKETIYDVKRLIGRRYDDEKVLGAKEQLQKRGHYEVIAGPEGEAKVKVGNKELLPEEVAAEILKKIKGDAKDFLGEGIRKAVITVPAYFDDGQKRATRDAGRLAGLEVVRIIPEPVAASLTYAKMGDFEEAEEESEEKKKEKNIMIFDLGAGTLDVVVARYEKKYSPLFITDTGEGEEEPEEVEKMLTILATDGDTYLGGRDMDDVIIRWAEDEFKREWDIDLSKEEYRRERIMLREEAERAKIKLSNPRIDAVDIELTSGEKITLREEILEDLVSPVVERCREPIRRALEKAKAKLDKSEIEIDDVILVGGPTNMAIVKRLVEYEIGKPLKEIKGWNPMECVAVGAAIQGKMLDREGIGGEEEVEEEINVDIITYTGYGYVTLKDEGYVYTEIIGENVSYPTSWTSKVCEFQIDVSELKEPVLDIGVDVVQRFYNPPKCTSIGACLFSIQVSGAEEKVEVGYKVDDDGILDLVLRHPRSNREIRYDGLSKKAKGKEIPLAFEADEYERRAEEEIIQGGEKLKKLMNLMPEGMLEELRRQILTDHETSEMEKRRALMNIIDSEISPEMIETAKENARNLIRRVEEELKRTKITPDEEKAIGGRINDLEKVLAGRNYLDIMDKRRLLAHSVRGLLSDAELARYEVKRERVKWT